MTQQFKHIAIVGKMHSGKSTLARFLFEDHGYARIGLADSVKDQAAMLMGQWYSFFGSDYGATLTRGDIERNKALFRPFLQWFGTEFVREYAGRPTYWIDHLITKAEMCMGPVVCDDVRFVNEAEALWDAGFMVVRVVRPEADRLASAGTQGIEGHASEMEQDGIEPYLTVPNDKGIEQLRGCAEILAEMVEGGAWVPRPEMMPGEIHRVQMSV